MLKARLGKEIVVRVTNEIGVINQLSKVIAEKGINALAVSGEVEGRTATMRFVTEDNLRISDALRAKHYAPHESECVIVEVPNKPGMLRSVTEKLATESIDIHHLYATAAEDEKHSLLAFDCTDNDHAVVVLNR